jgi:glycine cleavage system aminomethyltransferase T/glycine/D-amino acid oxidase-like deaminating enzyme
MVGFCSPLLKEGSWMDQLPKQASVVVIGAGIMGNCMARHLALAGWREIVLVDKGPLPNPGGSTGHASNFLFPVDHSKEMTKFTQEAIREYEELGVSTTSGGIEVARTNERLEEFRRRMASAKAWGEPSELLTPAEVKELVPFINEQIVLGGFYSPGVTVVDPLQAGTLMRDEGTRLGALSVSASTEVVGIDVKNGRIRGVRTDRGEIETDTVVVACGVWSPRIARMAGASIPLTPAVHQMIDVGPVPQFSETVGEIGYPIVRDVDTNMYERQHGSEFEIGSYAHRAILVEPDEIPSIEAAALSPTELPFTQEDFELQLEQALELFPEIVGDESVGIKYAINGLLSLTPDGMPILGESPEVRGLWSTSAVWVKEGPGIARALTAWMTNGSPEIDLHASDIARFYEYARSKTHVRARASEGYNRTYGIVHPQEQWLSNRDVRLSPFNARERELGAVFFETAGWERPHWYESNTPLLDEYGDRVMRREAPWESRWWSPIINAEHLAMRDRVGMVDLTAFAIFDVCGPGALPCLQGLAVVELDVPVGRVVYTSLLNEAGGIKADLTIMRLTSDSFRVVTGGATGAMDKKWFADHLPADGSVQLTDQTSTWCTLGVWGPRARDLVQSVTEDDVSGEAFPFATCRPIEIGTVQVLASRISYVGDLGWELYAPMEQGASLWDTLWEAGQTLGVVPVGIGVYATTGRLEKCYRAYGNELELEYNLVECGLARKTVKEAGFVGKSAYLEQRSEEPAAILCTLTVDDHASSSGTKRYMLGHEPILTLEGEPIVDRKGRRSYVTSAGAGPSVGKHILLAYLTPEHARVGEKLLVEYMGEQYPVTVAIAGSTPLFDPENLRVRA